MSELDEVLDEIEVYLDGRADAEGNSAADWVPNKEMRLVTRLRKAREEKKAEA